MTAGSAARCTPSSAPLLCRAGLRDAVDAVARTLGKIGIRTGEVLLELLATTPSAHADEARCRERLRRGA